MKNIPLTLKVSGVVTLIVSLVFAIIVYVLSNFSMAKLFYSLLLVPTSVFLFPILILTSLYALIYKKYSNQNEKLKRILYTSLYSLIVIFLWVVIEIFEQQMNVFLWDIQLIKYIVFKSDMRLGLCCFVPIIFLISYFFDNKNKPIIT